jgi:GTP1/Obg family GTP-binding protein
MTKKKMSRRLGILTEKETEFLFMDEVKKKTYVKDATARKYYERIAKSANQGFQDYSIMINRLPKHYRERINFLIGLTGIERTLTQKKITEQIPHRIFETTILNLDTCLQIINKQYNESLGRIANVDFNKVKEWLLMAQKYPKPMGAPIGL